MSTGMTFGSLFAGIGGIDLGLERAGLMCLFQVEIDDYAQRVLEKHWPNVPRFRDIRTVQGSDVPRVDILAGGFPCQDISQAGKHIGIDGARSGLWSEFHRLIREIRPRIVLVENVSALLVRGMDRVLGDLAASGYDAEWDCVPAAALGAHHRRDRVFVVAHADGDFTRNESKSIAWRIGSSVAAGNGSNRQMGNAHGGRLEVRQVFDDAGRAELPKAFRTNRKPSGIWATEPDVGRVAHGISTRMDRLKCLGNSVVPQVAEFIGRRIVEAARHD